MLHQKISESVRAVLLELVETSEYRKYVGRYSSLLTDKLAERFGVTDVLLTSSGTAAVELVLRAAGVGPGDEVVLSAYDYPGNFWAIERVGARPVLIDTLSSGWTIAVDQLIEGVNRSRANDCKAVIVSHLHGQLQPMSWLAGWCQSRGLLLIEDACQAMGAKVENRAAGAWGDAGIISFGGGKTISAGRGGALLTNNKILAQKGRIATGAGSGPNTMSELQSAVAFSQLDWLDELNNCSRAYFTGFAQYLRALQTGFEMPGEEHLPHAGIYQVGLISGAEGRGASALCTSEVMSKLQFQGILAGPGFPGFHRRTERRCRRVSDLAHTRKLVEQTLTLHHSLALRPTLATDELASLFAPPSQP
jgi:dTDP-4-amino-4,6-dideoxygalactose transaminase